MVLKYPTKTLMNVMVLVWPFFVFFFGGEVVSKWKQQLPFLKEVKPS